MSLTFSQELAASASASNEPECEPSPSARSINSADVFSPSTGQMSLFSETFEPSPWTKDGLFPTPTSDASLRKKNYAQGGKGLGRTVSMLSAAASPARTSVSPERARALAASTAAYGRSTPELLARFDPDTSSWRTSQLCLDGALSVFSETWPRSGLMRSGIAYQLPPLVRLTDEIESGLWVSPTAQDGRRGNLPARPWDTGLPLSQQVVMPQRWPTPQARDWKDGANPRAHGQHSPSLAVAVATWPSPKAANAERGGRGDLLAWVRGYENSHYPTPTANRRNGLQSHGVNVITGSLNPTWVEWLMGFPLGFTDLGLWATPSSRKSRNSSDAPS